MSDIQYDVKLMIERIITAKASDGRGEGTNNNPKSKNKIINLTKANCIHCYRFALVTMWIHSLNCMPTNRVEKLWTNFVHHKYNKCLKVRKNLKVQ